MHDCTAIISTLLLADSLGIFGVFDNGEVAELAESGGLLNR